MLTASTSRFRVSALALVLGLAGCDTAVPTTDPVGEGVEGTTPAALAEARATWAASAPDAYRIAYRRFCECGRETAGPWVVEVRGGAVVEATSNGERPEQVSALTVERLFETLADAFDEGAASVRFRYDADTGLPLSVGIDYVEEIADEEFSVRVTGFRALR